MRDIKSLLGKRIKELRKTRKWTQDILAEYSGIEASSLSNIETGKNYPNPETIDKLAKALGVLPFELYIFEHIQLPSVKYMIEDMNNEMQKNDKLVEQMYIVFRNIISIN